MGEILEAQASYRNIATLVLKTPRIREKAIYYYDCPSIPGMQLENQGLEDEPIASAFHFEATILQQEIMTAQNDLTDKLLSEFTIAILEDTGWYGPINKLFVQAIRWGRQKGCNFYTLACTDPNTTYSEFCVEVGVKKRCNVGYQGIGLCQTDSYLDTCAYYKLLPDMVCQDTQASYAAEGSGEIFKHTSRCFESTFYNESYPAPEYSQRCYDVAC